MYVYIYISKSNTSLFCRYIFFYHLSFSNIQQFCGYIKQLPSLDDKIKKVRKSHLSRKAKAEEEDMYVVNLLTGPPSFLYSNTSDVLMVNYNR